MLQACVLNVLGVSDVGCKYFNLDVSKVDPVVACVAMTVHAWFKRTFQVFHRFQIYVANVLSGCFKSRSSVALPLFPTLPTI
jgi:hypothetical protein